MLKVARGCVVFEKTLAGVGLKGDQREATHVKGSPFPGVPSMIKKEDSASFRICAECAGGSMSASYVAADFGGEQQTTPAHAVELDVLSPS